MPTYHTPEAFLRLRDTGRPLLDARSPAEFARGHVPGGRNAPVLSDAERDAVGKTYAREGREGAVRCALTLTGPLLADRLDEALRLVRQGASDDAPGAARPSEVLVHCWRGGMRSASLAWLLESAGLVVHVLEGGYKAYRAWVRQCLANPADVLVLGGLTGSGKTAILKELEALGSQVVDLEALAGHRGSAFGGVGLPAQPTTEAMENALAERWRVLDRSRPVWLEDEDRRIGAISLCDEFFRHIQGGRLIWVDVPRQDRVARLARVYGDGGEGAEGGPSLADDLAASVLRLEKRLGSETTHACVERIRSGRLAEAADAVLGYYDKLYARQMEKRPFVERIVMDRDDPAAAARLLRAFEKKTD